MTQNEIEAYDAMMHDRDRWRERAERMERLCPSDGTTCSAWVDAATKPRTGQKVIVCGIYKSGHRWRAMARWQPAGTIDATYWEEYPELWESDDGDTITNPNDMWLEESVELEQTGLLVDVMHWMPMPELPPHPYAAPIESLPQNADVDLPPNGQPDFKKDASGG